MRSSYIGSDFIWDFGKLPFPAHLGKYIIKNGKISTKIHEIGKIKTIFGLFVCLFALRPMSTAMVIAGRSVHLTTLFPGQA